MEIQMISRIIIIDNDSYPQGGTSQVAYKSAVALSERGLEVYYVCADREPNPELLNSGIKVIPFFSLGITAKENRFRAACNGIWDARMEHLVAGFLKQFDPKVSIIHIHGYLHCFSPSLLRACTNSGIPTALTLHDYFILCPCGGLYNFREGKICTLRPMSAACMACNCDKRSYLQKLWRLLRQRGIVKYARDNKKLSLIYISDFSYSKMRMYLGEQHQIFYVRNPYDVGDGKPVQAEENRDYVFLGRLSKEKGADLFCEAFSQLLGENRVRGRAVIVGDGEQREKLEQQYPAIRFLGWKSHEELGDVFASARALVFPSRWYEGAPLTPIEFMSHGIPCILSDSNAGQDYITAGEDGLVFRSEDLADMKEKILLAENDAFWAEICRKLRSGFRGEVYSAKAHVERLLEVYEQILEKAQTRT